MPRSAVWQQQQQRQERDELYSSTSSVCCRQSTAIDIRNAQPVAEPELLAQGKCIRLSERAVPVSACPPAINHE